ncbi:MAG: hypothetical protein NVSMB68_03510 [Thermoanaerobaculia bacterium]
MAKRRKSAAKHIFSAGQAKYVLERLIGERRITSADVQRYVTDMQREIGDLERRLQSLREATGDAIRGAIEKLTPGKRRGRPPGSGAAGSAVKRAKRTVKITAEQLASRQLQGRYLGLIRQIPAARRSTYQKIAKERGREAAIKEMTVTLKR